MHNPTCRVSLRRRVRGNTSGQLALRVFISALVALPLLACFTKRVVTTRIRHPMHIGSIDDNRVSIEEPATESLRGLPEGTLSDEGTLTRLDAEGMCFQLAFRRIDTQVGPSLSDYEVSVDVGDDLRIVQPDYHPFEPTLNQYDGLNPVEVQSGYTDVCENRDNNNNCTRWRRDPNYVTEYHPGVVFVAQGGGTLCFANQAYVTPDTPMIALVLKQGGHTIRFEWAFDDALE